MKEFKIASDVVEQFGNMIALRKTDKQRFPGIAELFVASVIQCQPMAEVEFLASGEPLQLDLTSSAYTPVSHTRTFENDSLRVEEELVVHGNDAALRLIVNLLPQAPAALDLALRVSGGILMSPQGVPYHWQEEKKITGEFAPYQLNIDWRDQVALQLSFSEEFDTHTIHPLGEDDVAQTLYFNTFNAKKRYRYWVQPEMRRPAQERSASATGRNLGYCAEKAITVEQNQAYQFELYFTLNAGAKAASFDALRQARQEAWEGFLSKIPVFESEHHNLMDAYYKSWFVLFSNHMQSDDPRFKYPFTSVNKFHYYNQFFWDSGFHAIPWIWFNDAVPAESELKNFVLNQWRTGMIPYELFLYDVNGREWMETDALTTAGTQPPVLSISLMEIYRKYGNKEFLEFFYEPLLRYEEWLWKYRDLGRRGLSNVYHIWESGTDNSPKFDSVHRNRLLDPPLEEVDFNVFVYLLRNTLLEMARILGKEPPARLAERMELTKRSANELMLDEKDGFYYDVWAGDSTKVRVRAFSGLLPLITDWPDEGTRERLVADYLLSEQEFNSDCPVPSVSMSEPTFDSADFWRGANWPQITWSFIYGLKDKHAKEAAMILDKYLAKSTQKHFCNEYCDSVTGQDVGLPFQGWGTLYVDLIIRHLLGIEPVAGGFRFTPLETRYESLAVSNVQFGGFSVAVTREDAGWIVEIKDWVRLTVGLDSTFEVTFQDNAMNIEGPSNLAAEILDAEKEPLIKITKVE
ncbi:MAG: glycogen debranching protein [Firmicutes bacterium]|nr:glycogen debranching protein [Bacillota bacterium]